MTRGTTNNLHIGLVIPPSPFLLDERVFVSLGVLRVAAVLERAGHRVSLLDLSGVKNYDEAFAAYLEALPLDALGITATTPQLPATLALARIARSLRPGLRLVLGGPHATLSFAALRLEKKLGVPGRAHRATDQLLRAFDVVVPGDGELAVLRALEPDSPTVVDGDDNRGEFFLSSAAYDELPSPARHLVDLNSYQYSIEGHRATSLIAQLGCPFNCGFCGGRNSKALRIPRFRTTAKIIAELEHLYRAHGYTGFMFYDDELNVSPALVELMNAITDLQSRLGVEFRLRGFVKAELFTAAQAAAMHRAGFRWLLTGFEAAHPRILENIEKRATLEDNTRAVELAKAAGLKVKALMSVGHPGESNESVTAIEEWLISMGVDDFDCTIITVYPGTPYYDRAVPDDFLPDTYVYTAKSGDKLYSTDLDYGVTADYYKGAPGGGYRAYVFTQYLTSQQLVRARDALEATVRKRLNIPFNAGRAALLYEHSMGALPPSLLRTSPTLTGASAHAA